MNPLVRRFFICNLLLLALWSPLGWAQRSGGGSGSAEMPLDARETVGTILLAGLVGGILGLSTLSFYQYPEDNIRNISFGAGIGIIAAALYLTLDVASKPLPASVEPPASSSWALWPDYDSQRIQLHVAWRF